MTHRPIDTVLSKLRKVKLRTGSLLKKKRNGRLSST